MPNAKTSFQAPSRLHNGQNEFRTVGFELEFSGLSLAQAGELLQSALGGKLRNVSAAESVLQVDGLGEINIELDWNFLKNKATEENAPENNDWLELLSQTAELLVPMEIVCPPLPINEMAKLDRMVSCLREAGAAGTEDSLIAAYGVHINTEPPDLEAATLFAYLRAFSLLQWWLVDYHPVDFTRKLSPYIAFYPETYLRSLFSREEPNMEELIADYLADNASRNRALDLLPLLAEIAPDQVAAAVDDPRLKARPAFHYRLPDCHIEKPEWSLAVPWNTWWVVEQLAEKTDALDSLGQKFLQMERPFLGVSRADWTGLIDQWLRNHALV